MLTLALLRISIETFDPWLIGIIGGAGLLAAMVPGSMLLMSAATLIAKNIFQPFAPSATEQKIGQLAKYFVPIVALVSVYFALHGGDTLATILLMGYSLMTQLFPSLHF